MLGRAKPVANGSAGGSALDLPSAYFDRRGGLKTVHWKMPGVHLSE